ncbi:MAG: HAD superfamily hydrolase (TIGR01509 family) [Planctomycetota bacterium]|jgi:HAD superfamily hydrolase (TIGR01509 family)
MKTILVDAAYTFVLKDENIIDQKLYSLLEEYENPKIILTNANEEQKKTYGLVDLPYPLFTLSHEPNKDNPTYFRKMLENFNLEIEDVVYFEHSQDAVESAKSVGIKSYHFNHEERDLISLKGFLDEALKG